MERRALGGSGLETSPIGLGCLGFTGGYGPVDDAAVMNVINVALDQGVTLLDTADFYGGGEVERLVGRAVAGRRDEAVVATRGGVLFTDGRRPTEVDGRPDHLRQACDASLDRLGLDHIDLYYLARPDDRVPIEDSVGGLAELVVAGKVRHVGLSEVTADQLRRAHAVHPIAALESEYSLCERAVEDGVLPAARELGVGFVAHSPLAKGLLADAVRSLDQLAPGDYRRRWPRFQPDAFEAHRECLVPVWRIASARACTAAQLALAWLLSRGRDIVAIPGARDPRHVAANAAAVNLQLTTEELAELTMAFTAPAQTTAFSARRG